jgi:hypothetical protein
MGDALAVPSRIVMSQQRRWRVEHLPGNVCGVDQERRADDEPLPTASRDPLEAGRNRYDSATWRRIYDSLVWRWVVGPLVYGASVAAFVVLIFDESIAYGLIFGAFVTMFVVARTAFYEQRRNRTDGG